MTLDQLRSQETFQFLTEKEQTFLIHYLLSEGDWNESVLKAYPSTNPKMIRQTANRLRYRPFIMQLIRLIDGTEIPTKKDFIMEGWATVQDTEGAAKVAALQFTARLCGHLDGKGDDAKFDLQKHLSELEKKHAN